MVLCFYAVHKITKKPLPNHIHLELGNYFFISDMKFKMSKIMKSSVKKEKIQIEIGIEHTLIYSSKETKKFTLMFWEPKDKFLSLQF